MAAGTFRWRGGTSGAWATDSNWIDETGAAWSGGRYPGSSGGDYDTVLLDAAITAPANALAAYDMVGAGNEKLQSFRVGPAYNQSTGLLLLDVRASADDGIVVVNATNAGTIKLKGPGTARGDWIITDGSDVEIDGKMQSLSIYKGTVELAAGTTVSGNLIISYITSSSDSAVTINSGATLSGSIFALSGIVTCNIALSALTLIGGSWTQYGAITTLNVQGGTLIWQTGNITAANIYSGGTLDGSGSQTRRTLTGAVVYPGGTLDLNNGLGNIAVGASNIIMRGGDVDFTPGTMVQQS